MCMYRRDRQVDRLQNELRKALHQNQQLQPRLQLGRLSDILPLSRRCKSEQRANALLRLADARGSPSTRPGSDSDCVDDCGKKRSAVNPSSSGSSDLRFGRDLAEPVREKNQGARTGEGVVVEREGHRNCADKERTGQSRLTTSFDGRGACMVRYCREERHRTTAERGGGVSRRKRIFHHAVLAPGGGDNTALLGPRSGERTSSLDRFRVQGAARYHRQEVVRQRRRDGAAWLHRVAYQGGALAKECKTASSHGGLGWKMLRRSKDDMASGVQQSENAELARSGEDGFRVFGRWKTTSEESLGSRIYTNDFEESATTDGAGVGGPTGRRRSDYSLSRQWSFSSVRSVVSAGAPEVTELREAWGSTTTTPLFPLSPRNGTVQTLREELLSVLSVGEREEAARLLLRANVLQGICTLGVKDTEQMLAELALPTTPSDVRKEAGSADRQAAGELVAQGILAPCSEGGPEQSSKNSREQERTRKAKNHLSCALSYAPFFLCLFALDYAVFGGSWARSVLQCLEWTLLLVLSRTQELRHGLEHQDASHPLACVSEAVERCLLFFLQYLRGVAEPPDDEVLLPYTEMLADQFNGSSWAFEWAHSTGPGSVVVSPRREGFSLSLSALRGGEENGSFCPREAP